MLLNEVCKKCSLTKKAVEYYIEQGLVAPAVQENGYRDFSDTDVARLKKISVLRGLGLSVADIRDVLSKGSHSLNVLSDQKFLEVNMLREKQRLMQELARTQDWGMVEGKLLQLQNKQSVLERLRNAFPGYYGNYVCQHFAFYLNEPIQTEEQQEAFDTILAFLDSVHLEIPAQLQKYYDEMADDLDAGTFEKISENVRSAVCDVGKFVDENREAVERWMTHKQTAEYKETPAYRLQETLRQFCGTSGYNDIFIPAMCRLSRTYKAYQETLQRANEKFLQMYPEWDGEQHEQT